MLYNGHLVIAGTFLRNRPNHGQTLKEKTLYTFAVADTSFEHRVNILGKIYLLIVDYDWLGKKESTCVFLFDACLYFNMKLIT